MGKDSFETFDSGSGPVIPDSAKGDMAHGDDGKGGHEVTQGAVPESPQSK